ncbi:methyltransferase domain-containing protein [Candidatus Kaiserbacteria bacterium]|nr:methyltransferase domain-containing protein [Candidatus Kaiserbacteria bacterium]
MTVRSPWRKLLYEELSGISLDGRILDLGGSRKSDYPKNFVGEFDLDMANLEVDNENDIKIDLEKPFPIADFTFDGVLCINVLEHIYNYRNVINETRRILKTGGTAIFAVPFLVQVHPSPNDHWRFTGDTLERLFKDAGFEEVRVEAVGTGVYGAVSQLKFNALHFPILRFISIKLGFLLDKLLENLFKGEMYTKDFYPLGYVVYANK